MKCNRGRFRCVYRRWLPSQSIWWSIFPMCVPACWLSFDQHKLFVNAINIIRMMIQKQKYAIFMNFLISIYWQHFLVVQTIWVKIGSNIDFGKIATVSISFFFVFHQFIKRFRNALCSARKCECEYTWSPIVSVSDLCVRVRVYGCWNLCGGTKSVRIFSPNEPKKVREKFVSIK